MPYRSKKALVGLLLSLGLMLMAAITMAVVPLIILFIIGQRHLVKGIQLGAVKG